MRILYLNDAMHLGEVSKYILKLCKELKNDNYIVVASHKGELVHELNNMTSNTMKYLMLKIKVL